MKPWIITTSTMADVAREQLPGYDVYVAPPPRPRGWEWLDNPFAVGGVWDRLVDEERMRDYRERAFWCCVQLGGCHEHGRYGSDPCGAEERPFTNSARRNGKQTMLDRFLEECRERNIPVTVSPVDVYRRFAEASASDWPDAFYDHNERTARRYFLNQLTPEEER
jgi:hypothetical protein